MADFGGTELEAFRAEARAWLEENHPKSLRGIPPLSFDESMSARRDPTGDEKLWKQRLAAKGWSTPTWPKAYGGAGLSQREARVVEEEMDRIGATNPMSGMGTSMIGPTLLEYGTEEQKKRH